jgi:DNA-binding MarR family transcriptional regulator
LLIKHNSAVGLVDRLVREKLVVRETSTSDRRKVELRLTGRGRQVLAKLAATHRRELQRIGPLLTEFFAQLPHLDGGRSNGSAVGTKTRRRTPRQPVRKAPT